MRHYDRAMESPSCGKPEPDQLVSARPLSEPTWIGCTPQFLDGAIATALQTGCEVVTIQEGLRRIES